MSSFSAAISKKFRGHQEIGSFLDPYRGRTVKVFDIDHELCVGLFDGTDAWVADRAAVRSFTEGKFVDSQPIIRRRVVVDAAQPKPIERKRVHVTV